MLAPDASFVRQERVETATEERGYFPGAPDFVAEVISPSDRYADVDDKVKEWLNAGTRMVVVVNPRDRTVSVHTPKSVITLTESDTLDGGDVVPGWRLSVADIAAVELTSSSYIRFQRGYSAASSRSLSASQSRTPASV